MKNKYELMDTSPFVLGYNDAKDRAEALLWEHLDAGQRYSYVHSRSFEVTTQHKGGAVTWRVRSPGAIVIEHTTGRPLKGRLHMWCFRTGDRLCISTHPSPLKYGRLPEADIMLALKLHLEGNIRHVIRHAHVL